MSTQSSDSSAVAEAIAPWGLHDAEQAAYAHLVESGALTANQLAMQLGIHRNQAYRIASSLVAHGLAEQTLERPMRFVPTPLDRVLDEIRRRARIQIEAFRRAHTGEVTPAGDLGPRVQTIVGRDTAYGRMIRMVRAAQSSVLFMDTTQEGLRGVEASGLCEAIARRTDIDRRCVLAGAAPTSAPYCILDAAEPVRLLVRDNEEVLVFVDIDERASFRHATDRAIVSAAEQLVQAFLLLFNQSWKQGRPGPQRQHLSPAPSIQGGMGNFRILIVDDEKDIAEAIQLGFEVMLEGVDARVAYTAQEGLAILRSEPIDLILSDYRMPGMNGLEFLAIAQKEFPHVPRVMLTAYPDADLAARAVEHAGVGLFVSKPFQDEYLVHLVKALQNKRSDASEA